MVSRSHLEERTKTFIEKFPKAKLGNAGSSVKFCRLAEGAADLYARLARYSTTGTSRQDTRSSYTAAGGQVTAPDGSAVTYGSAELLVPAFLAWGDKA